MQRNRNWVYLTKVAYNGAGSAVADSPRASARSAIIAQCILAFLRSPMRDVRRCAIALCASPSPPKRLKVRRGARAALKRASLPGGDRGLHLPRRPSGRTSPHVLRHHGRDTVVIDRDVKFAPVVQHIIY
jgi:hypothetical protein